MQGRYLHVQDYPFVYTQEGNRWLRYNGDEQITVGFAPPPGAINVAATPIRMSHYFLNSITGPYS